MRIPLQSEVLPVYLLIKKRHKKNRGKTLKKGDKMQKICREP